jgi:hypothetical protein
MQGVSLLLLHAATISSPLPLVRHPLSKTLPQFPFSPLLHPLQHLPSFTLVACVSWKLLSTHPQPATSCAIHSTSWLTYTQPPRGIGKFIHILLTLSPYLMEWVVLCLEACWELFLCINGRTSNWFREACNSQLLLVLFYKSGYVWLEKQFWCLQCLLFNCL